MFSFTKVHSQRGLGPRTSSVAKVGLSDLLMRVSLRQVILTVCGSGLEGEAAVRPASDEE